MVDPRPIGVFDSGTGGLTVLAALQRALPHESFVYLGDTARLPYGTKSATTVSRYALGAARHLVERNVKRLVVACNTASAVALPGLQAAFDIPVHGVVEPGARAAVSERNGGAVLVLATEGTIAGGSYQAAIHRLDPEAPVLGLACPMFVALAEEGWHDGPIALSVARRYLDETLGEREDITCVVLGCTHFPLVRAAIARVAGARTLVDSAQTTAASVAEALAGSSGAAGPDGAPAVTFLATDAPHRFARVGSRFLGQDFDGDAVEMVDL